MKKRLVSLLLSLLMVLTLLPVPALAEESGGATDAEPDIAVQAAEEEIPTEDEGEEEEAPSSTVIIDSITCVDADEDGYVRMMEGRDVSFGFDVEGNMKKSVHSGGVGGWHYKVEYTDTATEEQEEVTGDWGAILDATGYELNHRGEHRIDSDNQRIPWKAGEKYAVTVELGGKSITVNLMITANPVKSIQYLGDANTPIELVRGEDGQYDPQDDPDSGEWQYYPWRRNDVKLLVEIDGIGEVQTSCNRFYNDTGMHMSTQWYNDGNGMTAGAIYPAWIGCNGVGCVVKFKISEEPSFDSITPLYGATPENPLILKENSSGYNDGGVFYYGIDSARPQPQYTVTLTEAGKARYNIKEHTGTISTLLEKFNGPYSIGYEGRTVEEWPAADEPYEVTIWFGTVSCKLYVKVESNALTEFDTAISEDSPIEVEYGNAAGLVISAGKLGWDYHYPLRSEKLKFLVGFNGEEPQEYTSEQLRKKFGEEPERLWVEETGQENWKPGNVYGIQYQFMGKTCTVPVKVIAARHTLDKLEYSGGTLVLAKGVHNQITQWKDIFDFQSLENWPLLDITYDGKSTPEKMTWARAKELFGCEPSRIDMQLRNDKAWEVGEEGCVTYVGIRGQMVEIPIKIIAEPIVSLEPVEPITLICRENSDACYLPTYEYEFNVQLTQEAADAYNEGETSLTGTLNEICEKLNYRGWYEYLISSDQSEDNVWQPGDGEDHYFTVHLGKDFEVPVTLVNTASLFKSLELADPNYVVELTEGADAESCFGGKFAYNICQDDDLMFKLTLTDDGMRYFGKSEKTFERTVSQIFDEFQYGVKIAAEPADWKVGETAEWTVGLSAGMFGGPDSNGPTCKIKAKLVAETQVESITCTNGPIALYKDVDFAWYDMDHPEWRNSYTLRWALESERVRFEVKLTNNDVIKGSRADILRKLGFCPVIDNTALAEQVENPWEINSADHAFTVYLGTKSCKVPVTVNEPNKITIDEKSFPDENFRKYLKANWADEAGTILAEDVRNLDCSGWGIKDLTGIERFPNLYDLNCGGNELTKLSISSVNLRILSCYGNKELTNLDVSGCPNLNYLDCDGNSVGTLDVSENPALEMLYCADNGLRTLDVSKNTSLTLLYCAYNELTALDVSKNTALIELNCGDNPLPTLDISKNLALETLYCDNNKLTTLNVSNNTRLEKLDCSYNQLTVIYLPGTKAETNVLSRIAAFFAPATYADETNTVALTELDCSWNEKLLNVDASTCEKLERLACVGSKIDNLQLTVNVAKLEGLNLATVGAEKVVIEEKGVQVEDKPVGGEKAEKIDGAELTLTNGEKTYKTTVFGSAYRFDAVANGEYKLTITLKSDEGALVPYTTTVEIEGGKGLDLANVVLVQKGDVNLDGTIDVYDLQRLYEHASQINLLTGYALAVSNINGSGNAETNMQALFEQLTKTSKEGIDSAKTG